MAEPPVVPSLRSVLRPHWRRLAAVQALGAAQQILWIIEPFVFGLALDALIGHVRDRDAGDLLEQLAWWSGVFVANSTCGVLHRRAAERTHSRLYAELCTALSRTGAARGDPPAKVAARAELMRELVVFLDERAPMLVDGTVNLVGSLIALAFFDYRIALACLFVGVPLLVTRRIVEVRISGAQREEHDLREHNFEVFASGDPEQVAQHFGTIARVRVGAAGWSAFNFGVIRASVLGIFVTVLWIAIDIDAFTTGAIYSIVSYIWTFVTYAEDVPTLLEASSSLRDLDRRFAST